jgi:hypothetical protein
VSFCNTGLPMPLVSATMKLFLKFDRNALVQPYLTSLSQILVVYRFNLIDFIGYKYHCNYVNCFIIILATLYMYLM